MKLPALCSLLALASLGVSHAGSFGGPGPFTNLSPLQSGIDGSYQATMRGENITGVFRFAYQGGVQTPIAGANTYVIFVNGNVVTGGVTASITGKELAGVFGGQDFTIPTNEDGATELPIVFIVRGNRANGYFNGQIDLEDRMSAFQGDGQITGAPTETNTVIYIPEETFSFFSDDNNEIFVSQFEIPGGSVALNPLQQFFDFEFEGVRTSTTAQGSFVGGNTGQAAAGVSQAVTN